MSEKTTKKSKTSPAKTGTKQRPKRRSIRESLSLLYSSKKAGMPPGTLLNPSEAEKPSTKVHIIEFDEYRFAENDADSINDCIVSSEKPGVTWINIDGSGNADLLETLGKSYGFHPLVMEDIMDTDQRPKIEWYQNYIFIVAKMLCWNSVDAEIYREQVGIIIGSNYVISFQEKAGIDVFDPLRERIRSSKGTIRKQGADYIAYALLDAIVDNYFTILESAGEKVEDVENILLSNPCQEALKTIYALKRELLVIRKSAWPLRAVITEMEKMETPYIRHSTKIFLRDVYDHLFQVIETSEIFRDMLSGMYDIYLSSISYKTNEIMKTLAIIGTIFMPLTFLVGLYGMNFKHMPELDLPWAYPTLLIFMVVIAISMIGWFKVKKWI
ncbi:MAG: magnesium/cobalt transporter CorA [Firmicutes bacterium]|nr:magnesium/cobalt transporter CorA [Bacillota bacterium]